MSRTHIKWDLAGILGLGIWIGTAPTASAQFMPGFRPGFHWANPVTGQRFNYNFNYSTNWNFGWVHPVTGGRFAYNYSTTWAGFPPPVLYPSYGYPGYAVPYASPYVSPYMTGGYGSYSNSNSSDNPFVREQLRVFRNAPVPNQGPMPDEGKPQPGVDFRNKPANSLPVGLNRALIEPADRDILSGRVLNDLAATIRALEAKGAKAESPLLPAELVSHINYEGGPAANVLALLRNGKPATPVALTAAEHDALRVDLERGMTVVMEAVAAGKRPDAGATDRLAASVKKARETLAPTTKNLPEADAKELNRYLATLDGLAKVGKDSGTAGLFPQRWSSVGATVSEVVRHMDKFKLTFGTAGAGDEDVYYSLHRGLVSYYASLAGAKK